METVIIFILILGVLILVHELGHFITAIKLGIEVEEFAIGFPPRIFSWKKNGIKYSINWLPIGGFVKIKGESGEDKSNPHSFSVQPVWKKSIVVTAGVLMNFLLAAVLLSIIFFHGTNQVVEDDAQYVNATNKQILIVQVEPNSPAKQEGVHLSDEVVSIDGQVFATADEYIDYSRASEGKEMTLVVKRGDEEKTFNIKPEVLENSEGVAVMGLTMYDTMIVKYGFFASIWQGFKTTFIMIGLVFAAFYDLIKTLVTSGELIADVSGPVGVAEKAGEFIQVGLMQTLQFMAILSINLGVINILPFPALDGGRLLFIIIEGIRRKPLNEKAENIINNIGFSLLILLIIAVTFKDIWTLGPGIWESVKAMF